MSLENTDIHYSRFLAICRKITILRQKQVILQEIIGRMIACIIPE